ncbi:MAG: hypothetical protein WCA07_08410 [Gloeobacterales cyanobacterium]
MNKYVLLMAVVAILSSPAVAWCQSSPNSSSFGSPASNGGSGGMMNHNGYQQEGNGSQFQEHKAEILKRISERLAEVQKRQSCVQAANDRQALVACMPQRGERRGGHDNNEARPPSSSMQGGHATGPSFGNDQSARGQN